MSRTIDERVVSMQFDNKQFERNVKTSMGTLDKLKQSLNLKGAAKGLENINAAAKKVDFTSMGHSAERVGLKFSALYTVADQAFRNIYNSAEMYAKRITSAFTIDPIKTGFQEYETQIGAIQTILANTQHSGTNLDQVNSALDELNTYADKTIYNFTEMTRNIGTFTAAGVDLEKSVQSIKGIANLAAVSGSTSQQASTAMYQLSQALAAGKVSLMDWNSVVNAGMGGKVFQDALVRTSEHLKTGAKEAIKTYGTFRESLTQGEWLTQKVLTETLAQLSGAYSEADLIAQGYTKAQAKEIAELADTAVNAATKVKTFTQLMDTLKESAQSGWTQSWEYLVGDFEQSKSLWTAVSDKLGGIINASSESRNKLLKGALTSNWDKLIEKINDAGVETEDFEDKVKAIAKENGYDIDKLIEKYGSLEKVFKSGKISADILKQSIKGLTSAESSDLSGIDRILKRGLRGDDIKKAEAALEKLGYNFTGKDGIYYGDDGYYGTLTEAAVKAFQESKGLKVTGIIDKETLTALEKATSKTVEFKESLDDLIDGVTELGGRELLIQSFKNAFEGLSRIAKSVKGAFRHVFPKMTADQLYGIIEKIHEFSESLVASKETCTKVKWIFKGLFSVLDLIARVAGGGVKIAFTILSKIFSALGTNVLDVGEALGKALWGLREWIVDGNKVSVWFDGFVQKIADVVKRIYEFIKAFLELPEVQTAIEDIKTEFSEIGKTLKGRFSTGLEKFGEFIDRVKSMDSFSLKNIGLMFKDFWNNVVGYFFKNEDGTTIFDNFIASIKNFKDKIVKYFTNIGVNFSEFGTKIGDFLESIKTNIKQNLGGIMAMGILLGFFLIVKKVYDVVKLIVSPLGFLDDLAEGLKGVMKSFSLALKAQAVKTIAVSIAILAGALFMLAMLPWQKLWSSVGALLVVGAGLVTALILINKKLKDQKLVDLTKLGAAILSISGALLMFALAAKILGGVKTSALVKSAVVISGFLIAIKIMSKSLKGSTFDFASFGKMILSLSGALLIMGIAVGILGNMETKTLIKGGAAVGVFLLMMAGMMKATRSLEKDTPRFAASMIGLGGALLMMSVAVGILGNMETKTLIKGGAAVGVFLLMMAGMMKATKSLSKDVPRFGMIMIGLSTGLMSMALVVKMISGMSVGDLIKGGLVIAAFLGMMVGMMKATQLLTKNSKNAAKVGVMMLGFAGAMIILSGAIAILSLLEPGDILKATLAIGAVGAMFAGLIYVTKFAGGGKVNKTITSLSVAIGVLAVSLVALSFVDTKKLMGATAALSIVIGMFAVFAASTKLIGTKVIGKMYAMLGVVVALAGIIVVLSSIPNADKALGVATALSELLLALSAAALLLAAIGLIGAPAFIGVGVLAALLAVIGVFAGITIASLPSIGKKLSEFMTELQPFLDGMENIDPKMVDSVKTLAEIIMLLTGAGLVDVLTSWVPGGSPITRITKQLKPFAEGLNDFSEVVSQDTFDTDKIKDAASAAQSLVSLATDLSNGTSAWDNLTGKNLGTFGNKLVPFAEGLNSFSVVVSEDTFDTTKIVEAATAAESLVDLATKLSEGTSAWDNLTGKNLGAFGLKLVPFAFGLNAFSIVVSEDTFDTTKIVEAATAAESLVDLATKLSQGTSAWDLLTGKNLAVFGMQLVPFAWGLNSFSTIVSEDTFDTEKITSAANVAGKLVDLAVKLSEGTSVWDKLTGKNLGTFGTQLTSFGTGLNSFSEIVSEDTFDTGKIQAATDVASGLVTLATTLSEGTGVLDGFLGKDLSGFGSTLTDFGSGLAGFNGAIADTTFDQEKINGAVSTAEGLVGILTGLSEGTSVWDWFFKKRLDTFGSTLTNFGTGLAGFNGAIAETTFDEAKITGAMNTANGLVGILTSLSEGTSVWDWFFGKDLSGFGSTLKNFGSGLADFYTEIADTEFSTETVGAAIDAGVKLGDLAATIGENSAGWDWLTGKDNLSDFGANLEDLGSGLAKLSESISGEDFNISGITSAVVEIEKLAAIGETVGSEDFGSLTWFGDSIESLGGDIADFYTEIKDVSADKFSAIATGLSELASINVSNADTVQSFITSLGNVSTDGIDKFVESFTNCAPKVMAGVSTMFSYVLAGIKAGSVLVTAGITSVAAIAASTLRSNTVYSSFYSAGGYVTMGFANGIYDSRVIAAIAAAAMVQTAIAAAQEAAGVESPSKVFYGIATFCGMGLVNGLHDYESKVYDSGYGIGETATNGLGKAITKVHDIIENGIDGQPTIRPVVDLTNVENGANAINGMFRMNPSVKAASRVSAIGSAMNSRQHGSNDDVISAIKDLGKTIGNTPSNTYNVNGITYDDGSNISEAIGTIVRAARIERRV